MAFSQTIDGVQYELVTDVTGEVTMTTQGSSETFATKENNNSFILEQPNGEVIIVRGTEKVAEGTFNKGGAVVDGRIYDTVTDANGNKTLLNSGTNTVFATKGKWEEDYHVVKAEDGAKQEAPDATAAGEPKGDETKSSDGNNDPAGTESEPNVPAEDTNAGTTTTENGPAEDPEAEPAASTSADDTNTGDVTATGEAGEPQGASDESQGASEGQKEQNSSDHQESESPGGSLAPAVIVPVIVGSAIVCGLGSFFAQRYFTNKKALRAKNSQA